MIVHEPLDGLVEVDLAADQAGEDVAIVQAAAEDAAGIGHEDGIPGSGLADPVEALAQARALADGDRIAASDDAELLGGERRDPRRESARGPLSPHGE